MKKILTFALCLAAAGSISAQKQVVDQANKLAGKNDKITEARDLIKQAANEDDLHVYRPGLKALEELGIISPLARFHITKQEVKELAAGYGLSTASRPSTPCMATRIPYGETFDYALLRRIEEGEKGLRAIFTGNIRLRVHRDTARIELDPDQMEKAVRRREEICGMLNSLGFRYITLDLAGFCSGSMDTVPEHFKDTL